MCCFLFIAVTVFLLSTPVWLCPPTLLASQADSWGFLPGPLQHCAFYRVPWPLSPFLLSHFVPSPFAALIAAGIFDPSLSLPFFCLSPTAFHPRGELMSPDPPQMSLVRPHSLSPGIADGAHSPWISLRPSGTKKGARSQMTRHWHGLEDLK